MTRCYLAGPITKVKWQDAKDMFLKMEEYALEKLQFCEVVNPIDHPSPDEELDEMELWCHYMKISVNRLSNCDAILLAPNYVISKGARLEKYIAEELGLEVYKFNDNESI